MSTLNGVPLLLDGPGAGVEAWLNRYLPLEQARITCEAISRNSTLNASRSVQKLGLGLSRPNYPPPPPAKLNTLYWPTGAGRWAMGWFLATADQLGSMGCGGSAANGFTGSTSAVNLVLVDGSNNSTTFSVYLLTPRPIASVPESKQSSGCHQLYLLPVVDQRYNWQRCNCSILSVTSSTSWASLISSLGSALSVSITADTPNASYLNPDPEEFNRPYENAAVLLDAAAHSIGQRISVGFDGTVFCDDSTSANLDLTNNVNGSWTEIAGETSGKPDGAYAVAVINRKYTNHRPYGDGSVSKYSNNTGLSFAVGSTTETIHSTAYANFTSGSGTADNDSNLSSLASQIKTDYVAWRSQPSYDRCFGGVYEWSPCGFDDHVLFSVGSQCDGRLQAQTRVQSMPGNFGVDVMLQQDSGTYSSTENLVVIGPLQRGTLSGTLSQGGSQTVTLSSSITGATKVVAYDFLMKSGDAALANGLPVIIGWCENDNKWYLVDWRCP